jgi:hypothetical protein
MRRGFALLAILFLVGVTSAFAYVAESPTATLAAKPGELINDLPRPSLNGARLDTVYFGGDDGTGHAFVGGVWDFDTIVSDPFQGWTKRDLTEDVANHFYRVIADSFSVHGDGCTPMFAAPSTAQIWFGVHQDEADRRDFVAGMGYGNINCGQARSPRYSIASGNAIALNFKYFEDSEVTFDYTYVYLNCFNSLGDELAPFEVTRFDGIQGSYTVPSIWTSTNQYAELPAGTTQIQLEYRFVSDGGWSDEDGSWPTECGPFAADDIAFTIGATPHTFDFESGVQGWTFNKCAGIGADMAIWGQATWSQWLEQVGLACSCPMSGNVLGFCTEDVPWDLPGYKVGHLEQCFSGIVNRGSYLPPDYNAVTMRAAGYTYLRHLAGSFFRAGYSIYPYVTDTNPNPHWSPRSGQDVWYSTGDTPYCAYDGGIFGADLSHPPDGTPIPPTWQQMKFIAEMTTSCENFQIPPTACLAEGETFGSPLFDRVQVGLTYAPDSPPISVDTGNLFQDGFGQKFPTYLEPGDIANANIDYDNSRDDPAKNDWNADTAAISGPVVNSSAPRRWQARFCFKIDRKGPRQDMIPGYLAWRHRIAYAGDPEAGFVCVQMDSAEVAQGAYKHRYNTYFHESEPAFDTTHPDQSRWQEILPDSIWTPGTKLEYEFQAKWYDGTEWGNMGPWEFEILPGMRLQTGQHYDVEWPCVLYIDRFNRGSEYYIVPLLNQMGLVYDKYDALDAGSNYDTSIKRTFGGTFFNPGSWGNNGMTTDQILGYRLILFSLGTLGAQSCELGDFEILDLWLNTTQCGLADTRRALIMNGDEIANCMGNPSNGQAVGFMNNVLGATFAAEAYRDFNQDMNYCIYLEPASGAVFTPAAPGVSLYGNGCPNVYNYNVLGLQAGVSGTVGNLRYYSYQGTGTTPYVNYAQVVRQKIQAQVANWKTSVDGFSFHHLSERGCNGADCSADSVCVVRGSADVMGPELTWLQAGGAPFVNWRYPCVNVAVDDGGDTHLSGPVNFLYAARPNPFRGTAAIRYTLAAPTHVTLSIYDVSGRLVRTLVDGAMDKGENSSTWDGADNAGNRVGGGIFWMQMSTENGYTSSKKMVVLR